MPRGANATYKLIRDRNPQTKERPVPVEKPLKITSQITAYSRYSTFSSPLHREDGPAVVIGDESSVSVNTEDASAINRPSHLRKEVGGDDFIIYGPGEMYFEDGRLHRVNGPALIRHKAHQIGGWPEKFDEYRFYHEGALYREEGPAAIYGPCEVVYYQRKGFEPYRTDGPAEVIVDEKRLMGGAKYRRAVIYSFSYDEDTGYAHYPPYDRPDTIAIYATGEWIFEWHRPVKGKPLRLASSGHYLPAPEQDDPLDETNELIRRFKPKGINEASAFLNSLNASRPPKIKSIDDLHPSFKQLDFETK